VRYGIYISLGGKGLNCRTSPSDISGYYAGIHERHGTVGEWQGHGMGVCELTRHGVAGKRHGRGMASLD
jgi:hypothetical protein